MMIYKKYQAKVNNLHNMAVSALEQYKNKTKYDLMNNKYENTKENIIVLQEYIEEYRNKINNLNDVLTAYEEKFGRLK